MKKAVKVIKQAGEIVKAITGLALEIGTLLFIVKMIIGSLK